MNSKQIERAIDKRVDAARYSRVREWQGLLADLVPELKAALEELPGVIKPAQKLVAEAGARRPRNPNLPWSKELDRLHVHLSRAREYCNLTAPRIQEHLNKYEFCEPEHVAGWQLSELARGYRETARSLLSSVKFLRTLPEDIGQIESEIREKESYWEQREARGSGYTPPRGTPTGKPAPRPSDEESITEFDSRLV